MTPEKLCKRCVKTYPREYFGLRKNGYSHAYCPPCENSYSAERMRKYWIAHPEKRPRQYENNRKACLKRYGITPEQFSAMNKSQGGKCAICGIGPRRKVLDVDHCHETGRVRGLLCSPCNKGLGSFGDNVDSLEKAIKYLTTIKKGD